MQRNLGKKLFFVGILKANEKRRIRIRTKMLRIHNTDFCILTRILSKHYQYQYMRIYKKLALGLYQSSHLFAQDKVKKKNRFCRLDPAAERTK
jgi:hypothetical protein